ncbi:hypothetical protein BON22_0285 [Cyberlindnera fabianii]|uniref:Protein BNI4 n=1 Tax=Cyberlindnera fabianii TaxID=36022 RepID=A0A1V2LE81_CYBFA|nr:hypothetical protein BON22_0285 [Cyberlindnera fabianii]
MASHSSSGISFTVPIGDRTNSMTSLNSFHSTASAMEPVSRQHIARGSSTNDLLTLDTKFMKPSRLKPGLKHSASHQSFTSTTAAGQRYNSITSTRSARPIPRTNSLQSGLILNTDVSIAPPAHSFKSAPSSPGRHSLTSKSTIKPQALYVPQDTCHTASSSSNTNSYSSSPSPSRGSRTNSSLSESTPPSSIDDLSLQPTESKILENSLTGTASSSNLTMIEEHSAGSQHDVPTTTPTSDVSEKTITPPLTEGDVQSSVSTPTSPTADLLEDSLKSSVTLRGSDAFSGTEPSISSPSAPLPEPQTSAAQPEPHAQSQSPKPQPQSQPQQNRAIISRPAPATTKSSVSALKNADKLERKPSAIKRFFSKLFGNKKKPSSATLNRTATSNQRTSIPVKDTSTNHAAAKVSHDFQHPLQRQKTTGSDVFSFVEGDEDKGINVGDLANLKLDEPDFGSKPGDLSNLFANLSDTEPSGDVFQHPDDTSKDTSEGDDKLVVKKNRDKSPDAEDAVITFDDMNFIEKMIEYGETSFPDLSSSDLGKSQRKMMRSKSIERKKSIRSISSASKLSAVIGEPETVAEPPTPTEGDEPLQVIYTNQRREPHSELKSRGSILKTQRDSSTTGKKVAFTNHIYVNSTYPAFVYNRHARGTSSYQLSPPAIQQIRHEMNDFKRSMAVHEASLSNTHFFRA